MATLVFCHGRESGPHGHKISQLGPTAGARGWQVLAPDFRDLDNPDQRVGRLLELHASLTSPLLLVGSSMGGYVAIKASAELGADGLLLFAPAVGLDNYADPDPVPAADHVEVIHGWRDSLIDPRQVFSWCDRNRLTLHLVDDDHSLSASLPFLQQRLDVILAQLG